MSEPTESEVNAALASVLGGLMASAKADREASEGYKNLFAQFKDGGVAHAVFEAERQMKTIAMDLAQLLKDKAGVEIDRDLWNVILGLPLALSAVRRDVEDNLGNACCADKARHTLKTYFYRRLALDVEVVPFVPAPPAEGCARPGRG